MNEMQDSFNSRTPCGVRLVGFLKVFYLRMFQFTHPVRGATVRLLMLDCPYLFQFTHPVRGATGQALNVGLSLSVSIHAPRAGCDLLLASAISLLDCFNSRTPCGVRLIQILKRFKIKKFQFTHPVRGATTATLQQIVQRDVSIHAPRAGCDCDAQRYA